MPVGDLRSGAQHRAQDSCSPRFGSVAASGNRGRFAFQAVAADGSLSGHFDIEAAADLTSAMCNSAGT